MTTRSDYELGPDAMLFMAKSDIHIFADMMIASTQSTFRPHVFHFLIREFVLTCFNSRRRCVIVAPPEHGKSTNVLPFLAWVIGQDPTMRIGIVSRDADLASRHLTRIRKMLLARPYGRVFPGVKPDITMSATKGEWSKKKLYLQNQPEPCFEVFPLFGAVEGNRLDLIYADDCVTREALHSDSERKKTASALFDTFQDRLSDRGIMLVTNNCWHRDDAIHQMRDRDAFSTLWVGYRGTSTIRYNIHNAPPHWSFPLRGELPLWADQWPVTRLIDRQKAGSVSYRRAFEGVAVRSEDVRFPASSDWGKFPAGSPIDSMRIFGFMDPCGGKTSGKSDYMALVAVGRKPDGGLCVLDVDVRRATVNQQVNAVFDMHRRLLRRGSAGFAMLEIEMLAKDENWLQIPFVSKRRELQAKQDEAWNMPWRIRNPVENKTARIERLGPFLENCQLRWPADLERRKMLQSEGGRSWAELVSQIEEWPFGDHDDGPDALSGALALATQRSIGRVVAVTVD